MFNLVSLGLSFFISKWQEGIILEPRQRQHSLGRAEPFTCTGPLAYFNSPLKGALLSSSPFTDGDTGAGEV